MYVLRQIYKSYRETKLKGKVEILEDVINISPDDIEIIDTTGYCADLTEHFDGVSEISNPFVKGANHNPTLNVGFAERPYKGHYSSST